MSETSPSVRWPASMRIATVAEYLECSASEVERLIRAKSFGCVQYTERGDRRVLRDDVDAWLRSLSDKPIYARKSA